MKKLLIIMIILLVVNLGLSIILINKVSSVEVANFKTDVDSVINKVQIDSIELVITKKDCTIINIQNTIKDEINEASSLSDSASLELFERLVAE